MAGTLTRLIARGRTVNWIALYRTAQFLYRHGRERWDSLTPEERRRIGELLRKSRGRRANLTERERERLWALVKKAATGRQ
jgi:hypothetical protein